MSIMKRLLLSILEKRFYGHLRTVPISVLRCEQREVAIEEGWGGQPIDRFPPCGYYRMFNDGNEKKAVAAMQNWYHERFVVRRLHNVAKANGGMHNGSLYRLIERLHYANGIELEANLSNVTESLMQEAIEIKVQERIEIFKSIRLQGYSSGWNYISARKQGPHYILIDGHHRVAALDVCGSHSAIIANMNPLSLRITARLGKQLMGAGLEDKQGRGENPS